MARGGEVYVCAGGRKEMKAIKIEKSKIRNIISDSFEGQTVSVDEIVDAIWEYIEKTTRKIKFPVTIKFTSESKK